MPTAMTHQFSSIDARMNSSSTMSSHTLGSALLALRTTIHETLTQIMESFTTDHDMMPRWWNDTTANQYLALFIAARSSCDLLVYGVSPDGPTSHHGTGADYAAYPLPDRLHHRCVDTMGDPSMIENLNEWHHFFTQLIQRLVVTFSSLRAFIVTLPPSDDGEILLSLVNFVDNTLHDVLSLSRTEIARHISNEPGITIPALLS